MPLVLGRNRPHPSPTRRGRIHTPPPKRKRVDMPVTPIVRNIFSPETRIASVEQVRLSPDTGLK